MMFVTLLYAVCDAATGKFSYASGGHEAPLLVRADGGCSFLPLTDGLALGVMEDFEYSASRARLEPGDTMLLYTDGVTDAQNQAGEHFGAERLWDLFNNAARR